MKKKILAILVLTLSILALTSCGKKHKVQGELKIGTTTELSGDWIPYFQNNAADYDIYKLTSGYDVIDLTEAGEYVINKTVVKKQEAVENDDGTKTYTYTLNKGLKWNDDSEITAKDYVASALLWNSSVIGEMGAENDSHFYLDGWPEYSKGESKEFKAIRLLGDYEFSMTIAAENLPYFFELPMVSVSPVKLAFWTDDTIEVKDDGNGAYLSDGFTKEAFEATINKQRKTVPRITCGPYDITSYSETDKTAVLKVNPNFKGNYEAVTPSIETIIYKKVTAETSFDELETGAVDILMKMASGEEINDGFDLVDIGGFDYNDYDRAGYGKLQFVCDFGPTQFVEVRQALAHLLDRNDFAKAFTGGFGAVVDGPYGEAMWMYKETKDQLDEKLNPYSYSLEAAKELLIEGGWVYDEKGNDYESGLRHKKMEDGSFMPLVIEWASTEDNPVSELLVIRLQENADVAAAGLEINQTVMTFTEMLNYLYRDGTSDPKYGVPEYGMYNLATNFTPRYDLANTYTSDPAMIEQGYNTNFLIDEELSKLAQDMVLVDGKDKDEFKRIFVEFNERWNKLLPDLPLYSNTYHDFFNEKLKDYNANSIWDMSQAILYAFIEE